MNTTMRTRPRQPRISIVIPAKNEARNLEVILPLLPSVHEVILVDGHSVDGTVETATRVMPEIVVVHQTRKGKGNALACGFAAVTGDIIVMFDADGSADPLEIPRFVDALLGGADFAKGSRFARGGGSEDITRFRSLGNHGLNFLANRVLRTALHRSLLRLQRLLESTSSPTSICPITASPHSIPKTMLWGDGFEIETVINCRVAAAKLRVSRGRQRREAAHPR